MRVAEQADSVALQNRLQPLQPPFFALLLTTHPPASRLLFNNRCWTAGNLRKPPDTPIDASWSTCSRGEGGVASLARRDVENRLQSPAATPSFARNLPITIFSCIWTHTEAAQHATGRSSFPVSPSFLLLLPPSSPLLVDSSMRSFLAAAALLAATGAEALNVHGYVDANLNASLVPEVLAQSYSYIVVSRQLLGASHRPTHLCCCRLEEVTLEQHSPPGSARTRPRPFSLSRPALRKFHWRSERGAG